MRWKIDECSDANSWRTLREDDGTENGNLETCIATVYGGEIEQKLIESAPLLKEQVRLLRKVLEKVKTFEVSGNDNVCAWVALTAIENLAAAALEATKEGN